MVLVAAGGLFFAATRRRGALVLSFGTTGGATATSPSSIWARNGVSTGEPGPSVGAGWDSPSRAADANSIVFEPFPEAGFDKVGIGGNQQFLGCKVLVDPIRCLVRGF